MHFVRCGFIFIVSIISMYLNDNGWAQDKSNWLVLEGKSGVEAIFEVRGSACKWIAYRDVASGRKWDISGPYFRLYTIDGKQVSGGGDRPTRVIKDSTQISLEQDISSPPLTVRRSYSFCKDNRTLRIQTSLRSEGEPIVVKRIDLLKIAVSGEKLHLTGPDYVSFPIFGQRIFAGIEHPSVECSVKDDTLCLSQSSYTKVGREWVDLPAAIFGSASDQDFAVTGGEGLRRAFIHYLDGIRIKPNNMYIHYNDWWTAPIPPNREFFFQNIDKLKKDLYDQTGFFFDSYILDAAWSDRHSVWEINYDNFPDGFTRIRELLGEVGSRPGLWVSPSSLYPSTLDNNWLKSAGYEVTPHERLGYNACLVIGGKYQSVTKKALLKHTQDANLAHIKFDGFVPVCNIASHGHPIGSESYLPLAEGIMDVFDALREFDSEIILDPTCFGYQASPWWLMHVPSIIGPFGDDSPKGRCPAPDWLESMTTAREIANLEGRDAFLMPSSALSCFDIVVQCPSAFQNHAVMAVGRGRWFVSCYINPDFMDAEEWRFFADLMAWARHNRELLREPIPIGGNPANREAYGYAYRHEIKELYCLRNPWMEETSIALPISPMNLIPRNVRSLYPRRERVADLDAEEALPSIHLGPYETKFIEVVTREEQQIIETVDQVLETEVTVSWNPVHGPEIERIAFQDDLKPFGSSWTCPEGDTDEILSFKLEGHLEVKGAINTKLFVLCEGRSIKSSFPRFELTIDGVNPTREISRSVGSFSAGGYTDEDWVWFIIPLSEGRHHMALRIRSLTHSAKFGVFIKGTVDASQSLPPFEPGPSFPLYHSEYRDWSHTIVSPGETDLSSPVSITRNIDHIEGIYLDALDWEEASTGWGTVQRNLSIKGQPMTMGGRLFHRGIGTHSFSRIVYKCPPAHQIFAATIGCDQKALAGTIVFVVEGDGKELFRSPVFRADSIPLDIRVPINGIGELALILEDSGDRINADHGNWANARLLK